MSRSFPWTYNEAEINAVTDYQSQEEAARYDARMRTVRDVDGENAVLVQRMDSLLSGGLKNAEILEIGTGTGAFARFAAARCSHVTALDVSAPMLAFARQKAQEAGISNVEFRPYGFLSFDYPPARYDVVFSSLALHHLNDVWKAEAVKKIFDSLKPGGVFVLMDVIFDCEGGELDEYLTRTIDPNMNESMKIALYGHIRLEDSTFRWIMEEIAARAGFELLSFEKFGVMGHLLCARKPASDV